MDGQDGGDFGIGGVGVVGVEWWNDGGNYDAYYRDEDRRGSAVHGAG